MLGNFKPHGSMVLVREIEDSLQTVSGIYLTEAENRYTRRGEVISVGDGDKNANTGSRIPNDVEEGDVVYFTAYAGNTEIYTQNGEKLILLANRDILAREV
jgi:chaperonin GroES